MQVPGGCCFVVTACHLTWSLAVWWILTCLTCHCLAFSARQQPTKRCLAIHMLLEIYVLRARSLAWHCFFKIDGQTPSSFPNICIPGLRVNMRASGLFLSTTFLHLPIRRSKGPKFSKEHSSNHPKLLRMIVVEQSGPKCKEPERASTLSWQDLP